jgi:Holliday junction DNA helicase RuvA
MISRLRGNVIENAGGHLVLDVGGVGYEVAVTEATGGGLPPSPETTELYIRLINREGAWDLYGFAERSERDLFDLLIGVTGVGPKVALNLIGALGADRVAANIAAQDARALMVVSGVGQKLAQRLVLELAEKVALLAPARAVADVATVGRVSDVESALIALGYPRAEARRAAMAAQRDAGGASLEDLVRRALAGISGT